MRLGNWAHRRGESKGEHCISLAYVYSKGEEAGTAITPGLCQQKLNCKVTILLQEATAVEFSGRTDQLYLDTCGHSVFCLSFCTLFCV